MAEKKEEKTLIPDPEELVEVTVQTEPENIGQTVFCSVNGTAIYIPCGEPVKVKRKYAEVMKRRTDESAKAARRALMASKEATEI